MKVYFNSIGQFIEQNTSMDLFVKGNNGNVVECYFNGLDISNPNLIFRLIIQWSDGTTTNELLMNKSLKNEYVYLTLPILKVDGMTQFIVRIYDYNTIRYTAIFERKIFENIEASDETNISSEEYQALQNSIADINEDIVALGLEIDNNAEDINKNNAKIEALQNVDKLHNKDIEDLQLNKQEKLVNQENIKSIDNETLLGAGNIDLEKKYRKISDSYNKTDVDAIKNQLLALINTAQETADNKVNSSYVASEINKAVANLINNSPSALDTLQELAKALNNDPNFATTIANQIGLKANTTYVDGIKLALQNAIETEKTRITNLTNKVNENYNTLDKKIDNNYDTLDSKINTEITNIDKRVSANESNISKNANDINTLNSGLSSANNNINKKLDKAQGTTQANKVAITNSNGNITFVEKIPSANLPDTGVSVDTAKNVESSSGRIITGAEIEAVIDDTTKVINAKVDCDHRYEITGATGDEHNLAIEDQQMLINKISGRTLVRNQLFNYKNVSSITRNGLTLVNNGDGSFTFSGSHTISGQSFFGLINPLYLIAGHKYCLLGSNLGGSTNSYGIYVSQKTVNKYYGDFGEGKIFENTTNDESDLSIFVEGEGGKNLTFKPQLIDLTQAYGAGNEPTTAEEVLNDFPEYIPYDEGTFVHSNNKLISTGKNLWKYGNVSGNWYTSINLDTPLKAGTYTISGTQESNDTDNSRGLIEFNTGASSNIYASLGRIGRDNYTFTLPKDVYVINFYASLDYNSSTNDKFTFKDLQIEYGEVATEYEPYKEEVIEGIGELKQYQYIDNISGDNVDNSTIYTINSDTIIGYNSQGNYKSFYIAYIANIFKNTGYSYHNEFLFESPYIDLIYKINDSDLIIYTNKEYLTLSDFLNDMNGVRILGIASKPTIIKNDNLPAGMAVHKGGMQIQEGTIPYNIEKQYALSVASQVAQNIEIDREQQEQINDLKKDIANISFDGYTKEESDNKYAFKTTVSNINSQLSSLNANKLNAEQVQEKINQSISDLINSAPSNLDTLGEIAQALKENDDVADALAKSIGQKIDKPQDGSEIKLIKDNESFMFYVNKIIDDGLYTLTFDGKSHICNTLYIKGNAYIPIVALEKEDDSQGVQCYLYVLVYEDRNVTEIAFSKDVEFVDVLNITDPDISIYIKKLF